AGTRGAQCVSCHMPTTTYMRVDPRHDHRFGVPRPGYSAKLGAPDVCTGCHTGKKADWADAEIAKRGSGSATPPAFGEAFRLAHTAQPGSAQALLGLTRNASLAPIVRATALAELAEQPSPELAGVLAAAVGDPDALVRRTVAVSSRSLPPAERWPLAGPLLAD